MASRKFQDSMPLAPLKIIAMDNCKGISKKVNDYITNRRKQALQEQDSPEIHCSRGHSGVPHTNTA